MELEAGDELGGGSRLMMTEISHVFTIARVAEMLGEPEDWLHELSIDMFPEHGCLCLLGVGDEETVAFTQAGIERLQEMIGEERRHGRAPPPVNKSD